MPSKASFAAQLTIEGGTVVRQGFADTATAAEQSADRTAKAYDKTASAAERAAQKEKARLDALRDQANALFSKPADAGAAVSQPTAPAPSAENLIDKRRYMAAAQSLIAAVEPAAEAQRMFNAELERANVLMQKGYVSAAQYDAYVAKLRKDLTGGPTFGPATSTFTQNQAARQSAAMGIADQINPAGKLQREYNAELERANGLLKAGALSQSQYDAYAVKLKQDLAQATNALREHSGALGLNRMQYITAQSAVLRFSDSVIAGQSPLRAFALEAHKLVEIVSMDDDGMGGGIAKVTALINPFTIGLAALTVGVVAASAAALQYAEQLDHMEVAASGFGRTSQLTGSQLLDLAQQGAGAGRMSVKAAEDVEGAILQQTRTSAVALAEAIAITRKFSDAMGIDTKKAAEDLGKALADPAKGADELAAKYGYLTQAQVEHIHQLMEENNLTGAQEALLGDLGGALDRAGDHVLSLTKLWQGLAATISNGWNNIGASINHMMGSYTDAEKVKNLQDKIFGEQRALADGSLSNRARAIAEAQLKADQTAFAKMVSGQREQGTDARNNQLAQQARQISSKYSLDPSNNPKLEELKAELSTMEAAQRAGQKVDAVTVDALRHAVRTFMTPDQQRVAIAQATADMRNAAPHSQARSAAAQRLTDARTAGRVETEDAARDEANARGQAALGHAGNAGAKHAETLARQADAMNVAAAASLQLADAYLAGGAAALKAEAYRKAATDATKKGIDVEAQMTRELQMQVAEQVANLAKTIRSSEDEAAARQHVVDMVKAGMIPARDMDQQLQQENALRPMLALKAVAHGDALAKLTVEIDRYKQALGTALATDRSWAAQQSINTANDNAGADNLRAALAGVSDPVERARRTATANDNAKGWSPKDVAEDAAAQGAAATAKQKADSAEWLANTKLQMDLQGQLLEAQMRYHAVKDPDDQDEILALKLKQQLLQQHLVLSDQEIAAVLAQQKANKDLTDQLERQKAGYQALRDDGAGALEKLTSPDGIQHWGDTWRSVLRQVLTDIEKLAILNPLENMLFGGNRATLGGGGAGLLGSLFGGLFGGGTAAAGAASSGSSMIGSLFGGVPAFAGGTDSAPGGLSLVGEEGPELVNLPRGAGVMTSSETRAALKGNSAPSVNMPITINAQGAGPREIDLLRVELRSLKQNIPSMAVSATTNARQRRYVA